jgi:hypothetical protein
VTHISTIIIHFIPMHYSIWGIETFPCLCNPVFELIDWW